MRISIGDLNEDLALDCEIDYQRQYDDEGYVAGVLATHVSYMKPDETWVESQVIETFCKNTGMPLGEIQEQLEDCLEAKNLERLY